MGLKLTAAEKLIYKGAGSMNEKIMAAAKMNVPTVGPKCKYMYF